MTPGERLPTAQRRRQIAEAALRIIASRGVSRMTAAALAEQVGIADGTIFRHFKDKEEIVAAAIDVFETALEETFPPTDGDPLQRLGAFVVNRLTVVRSNPEMLRLAFSDRLAEAAGEDGAARVERLVNRSVAFIHDCLAEAQSEGQVTPDTPVTLLVWMVIGVVRGAATTGQRSAASLGALADTAPEAVWRNLEHFLRGTAVKPNS